MRSAVGASLLLGGCGGDGDCQALCRPRVTFQYATPQPGNHFRIVLGPNGTIIDCDLSENGDAVCSPGPDTYQVVFASNGLTKISWRTPPAGTLHATVEVDGRVLTDKNFDYEPGANDACGGECSADAHLSLD